MGKPPHADSLCLFLTKEEKKNRNAGETEKTRERGDILRCILAVWLWLMPSSVRWNGT